MAKSYNLISVFLKTIDIDKTHFVFYLLLMWQALKEGREPDLSDYKQFKIQCDNVGFQMLEKMGWKEGEGLGSEGQGIKEPVNKYVVPIPINIFSWNVRFDKYPVIEVKPLENRVCAAIVYLSGYISGVTLIFPFRWPLYVLFCTFQELCLANLRWFSIIEKICFTYIIEHHDG